MNERDKRALGLLALALVAFAILQLDIFQPSSGGGVTAGAAEIEALEQRLAVAQLEARQRPLHDADLTAALTELERLEAGLAQAEMRTLVGDLLTAEGVAMQGSRFGTVELEEMDYARVPLVVDFTCGVDQLVNLTAAIANAPQLLTTRDMTVRPGNAEVKSLRVQMTVAGYLPAERTPDLLERASALDRGVTP
jgi:Tfp pilus assembly protein PilO